MTGGRSKQRATVMVLVLIFLVVAGGLLGVVGATVAQLVRTTRTESDRAVLRQMIDGGVAWAHLHSRNWPRAGGKPDVVKLDVRSEPADARQAAITLTPLPATEGVVREVRVEARLSRPRGPDIQRVVTAVIGG